MFGLGALFKTATPAPKKEDSAFAIANLVLASRARDLSDFYQWCSRREENEFFSTRTPPTTYSHRPLNPFAVESFAQALFRRIGIRTAPTRIVTFAEARELRGTVVVKFAEVKDGRLTLRAKFPFQTQPISSPAHCLVCEVIEDAATFDFIARRFGISPGFDRPYPGMADVATRSSEKLTAGLTSIILRKECPATDALYANFHPNPGELEKIRTAMRWNGRDFLRICAARAFVGCSAPHNANVLATRSGELVSIDHCTAARESGEDLEYLFRFINRSSSAFNALADIAALAEDDVCAATANIWHPACGSAGGLAEYFVERLALWKALYAGEPAPDRAVATSAV